MKPLWIQWSQVAQSHICYLKNHMQLTIVIICVSILFSEPDELFGESNFTTHWCQKDEMKFQNELKVQLQVVFHEEGLSVYQQNTMPVIDCIMRLEALYDVIKDLPGVTSIFSINLSRWVHNLMCISLLSLGDIPVKILSKYTWKGQTNLFLSG